MTHRHNSNTETFTVLCPPTETTTSNGKTPICSLSSCNWKGWSWKQLTVILLWSYIIIITGVMHVVVIIITTLFLHSLLTILYINPLIWFVNITSFTTSIMTSAVVIYVAVIIIIVGTVAAVLPTVLELDWLVGQSCSWIVHSDLYGGAFSLVLHLLLS